ncbi:MAG TPA: tetratricopeptide repeat protein [Actinomycetota bacterium]|nr:tetratricopeptide repeat protein [Actinomycetota bacterium]
MPKAMRPRPGPRGGPKARRQGGLPSDVVSELRHMSKPGRAEDATRRLERAVQLLERGDARGAAAEASKAKEVAPRAPTVREILGLALYGLERYQEALSEMQAYRRMSGRADQNHIIADCLRSMGRSDRAVPLAEEALGARGVPIAAKAEAVIVAASALADQGKFDQALGMLRRIRTRDDVASPEVLRVWYVTGDILERSGHRQEAQREFRKIVRHDPSAFDAAERAAQLA